MIINHIAISAGDYEILAGDYGVDFVIGEGVDMNDPTSPKGRQCAFRNPQKPAFETKTVEIPEINQSTISYIESTNIEEYAKNLSINVRANYGLSALQSTYKEIISRNQSEFSFIVRIQDSKTNHSGNLDLTLKSKPPSEGFTGTDSERTYNLLQTWGSHYVQNISFGYEIAFAASVSKSSYTRAIDFQASLQAAFGGLSAGGGIDLSEVNKLTQAGVRIEGRISSGGITPDVPRTFYTITDISRFLGQLEAGEIKIKRGPLKLFLQSYYAKFSDHQNTQRLISPLIYQSPKSDFGVPSGTIIAFSPRTPISQNDTAQYGANYWIPQGWLICDGTHGTPDLVERFILGSLADNIHQTGGSIMHEHILEQVQFDLPIDASHTRDGTRIYPAEHMPPYHRLIYLMKE